VTFRLYAGVALGLGLCCCAGAVKADQTVASAAGLSQPLLDTGVSARAMGLGDALVALDHDPTALWFNPAGLAGQAVVDLGIHHDNEMLDALRETAVLGLPLGPAQGAALAVDYVSYGTFDAVNDQGVTNGSFTASEMGLLGGYGFKLGPGLSLGGQARFSQQRLADVSRNLWEGTGGLLYQPVGALSLGVAWTAGQDVLQAWQTSAVNAGLAWQPELAGSRPLAVALQGQWLTQDRSQVTLAAEWSLSGVAVLRGAWQEALYQGSAAGPMGIWCVGGGLTGGSWSLDYGVVTDHPLGYAQRLSLGYAFGAAPHAAPAAQALAVSAAAADTAANNPGPAALPPALPATAPLAAAMPAPLPVAAPIPTAAPVAQPSGPQFGVAGALPSSAYVEAFQDAGSGRLAEALTACRNGVAANPGDALCWREMGLVYDRLGRPDYARPCMAACLRLQPNDAEALLWVQQHP
jgi:hypothetical protein